MGTTFLIQKGKDALIPLTEEERIAKSAKTLSDILETEQKPGKAYYDEPLRNWRGATNEVTELTDKELDEMPVNGGAKIKTLKLQYGSLLKVYQDSSGHLYVQRPTRDEYIRGIREGKASGDPELLALSKVVGKSIELKMPDGKVRTFTPDGKVLEGASNLNAIKLDFERNEETGIGHVTGAKNSTGFDCLYEVVGEKAGRKESIQELREKTAGALGTDEGKQFYHDWSLQSGEKEFMGMGQKAPAYMYATEQLYVAALECNTATAMLPAGVPTGGATLLGASYLYTDCADRAYAGLATLLSGEKVETTFSRGLQNTWNLSPEVAEYIQNFGSAAAEFGPGLMRKAMEMGPRMIGGAKNFYREMKGFVGNNRGEIVIDTPRKRLEDLLKDLDSIAAKGEQLDRNGLTNAAKAAQKHGDRVGSSFPMANGKYKTVTNQKTGPISKELRNEHGRFQLQDIITHPQREVKIGPSRMRIFAPDGRIVIFRPDGSFYFEELSLIGK